MDRQLQLEDIARLQQVCESHDNLALKLNWETLETRKDSDDGILAEYREGELVGFLGKYDFGSTLEMCGMVHPDFRRQGIFTIMLKHALDEATFAKYSRILLNAPANSASAKEFMKSSPFAYAFSEYQMKLEKPGEALQPVRKDIVFRHARPEDIGFLAGMDTDGFGISPEETVGFYRDQDAEQIAENELLLQDGEPVGKVRVTHREGEAWIYGFVVGSTYRGQGIGRAALRQIVDREHSAGYDVWLEVALDNPNAMKLYESTGFKVIRAQDYYEYNGPRA